MLLQVGPDFYDEAALADAMTVDGSSATVDDVPRMRAEEQILALATADDQWIHPTWQVQEGRLLPGLPDILKAFRGHPAWSAALWLTTAHDDLDGSTPVDALKAGAVDAVLTLAARTAQRWAD